MNKELKTENDVKKEVIKILTSHELSGKCIWWERLNSGKIGNRIQLCKPGTPDFVSLFYKRNGSITALFIECKKPGKKVLTIEDLRYEQKAFFKKMYNKNDVKCLIINNPDDLRSYISII